MDLIIQRSNQTLLKLPTLAKSSEFSKIASVYIKLHVSRKAKMLKFKTFALPKGEAELTNILRMSEKNKLKEQFMSKVVNIYMN